jgi:2-(1,2-epoxy-1,2-dihydrophenyl)acetyl-CoA isomerase
MRKIPPIHWITIFQPYIANNSSGENFMGYQYIIFQIKQGVARITLNRPDVLNSFNRPMAKEVQDALAVCERDDTIRVVLLTGEGRAFSAGQDLAEAAPQDQPWPEISDIVRESYNPIILTIRSLEKPVVCAVNGVAAGAAANIALACDLVLASEKASFLQAFCHIGLIPDSGGTFFLPRLAGFQRAAAMAMLGEKVSAAQALEWGMIYKVYPADALMEEAKKLAAHLATQPTRGLGLIKCALNQSLRNTLEAQLELEAELQAVAGKTKDCKEGISAFLKKRTPKFVGK